jgi:hypothetical protein
MELLVDKAGEDIFCETVYESKMYFHLIHLRALWVTELLLWHVLKFPFVKKDKNEALKFTDFIVPTTDKEVVWQNNKTEAHFKTSCFYLELYTCPRIISSTVCFFSSRYLQWMWGFVTLHWNTLISLPRYADSIFFCSRSSCCHVTEVGGP